MVNHDVVQGERTAAYSKPYLTYAILVLIFLIFIIEQMAAVEPATNFLNPAVATLSALGGLDHHTVIDQHEWWRLFLGPLLHAGPFHILFNALALYISGIIVEHIVGMAWFGAVFVISAISGAYWSLTCNPDLIVSVGASGAIMGLFSMTYVASMHFPSGSALRTTMRNSALQVLIPSMLPIWTSISGQKVDLNAHIGGALGGVFMGCLLLIIWPKQQHYPSLRYVAAVIGLIGLFGLSYGISEIAYSYKTYSLRSALIPATELSNDEDGKTKSDYLVEQYPQDPRSHLFRALAFRDRRNIDGFKNEIYQALKLEKIIRAFFKPDLEARLRIMLAMQLQIEGNKEEAFQVTEPVCKDASSYKSIVEAYKLCP